MAIDWHKRVETNPDVRSRGARRPRDGMKPLYNGMLPRSLVRRLADLRPEAYLRAHAAEIEAFAAPFRRVSILVD
jgi:hypothetical protein